VANVVKGAQALYTRTTRPETPATLREVEGHLAEVVSMLELEDLPALAGVLEVTRVQIFSRITRPESRVAADPDRLLTVEQVAERTGFSADYVYRHRRALPFLRKVGRSIRASERELSRWLSTRRQL